MNFNIPSFAKEFKFTKRAIRYAKQVVAKKIEVNESPYLCCKKFLEDIEREKNDKNFSYYFDRVEGERVCVFAETLQHVKGEWASKTFTERFIKLEDWQCFLFCCLFGWKHKSTSKRRYREVYIEIPRKNGKALAIDTPIPTPNGFVLMKDLKVGDKVYGTNGEICNIINTTDIMYGHNCYELTFTNGEKIIADEDHQWITDSRRDRDRLKGVKRKTLKPRPSIKNTKEIFETLEFSNEHNHRIQVAKPIQNKFKKLPLDPYVLGVWLGDGHSNCACITCGDKDYETLEYIKNKGYPLRKRESSKYCYALTDNNNIGFVQKILRNLNLINNKHIPNEYLFASYEQRLELLQGLMDTDGTINVKGQCEFTQKNKTLAIQTYCLIQSLGLRASVREKQTFCNGKDCGIVYRVFFHPYNEIPVFKLTRKLKRQTQRSLKGGHQDFRTIKDCKKIDSVPVKCIEVDSVDHCYLASHSFIRTHNSFISAVIGLYMFLCDHEPGAEVYCGATSLDQALKVFEPAKLMVEKNKALKERYNIEIKTRFMRLRDGSIFKPIVAKPKDGDSPHLAILDEYHQHPNDKLYQSQATGQGARSQPMLLVITTAGADINSPCHELHDRVLKEQQLDYELQDQSLFGLIYSIDKDDDPYCLESLIKANPNFNVSAKQDYLERQLNNAKKFVNLRNDYLTKHLNVWVSQSSAYFDILAWQELENKSLDIKDYKDCDCFISVDMSAKFDFTVINITFVKKECDGQKHLYTFQETYLPEETVFDTTNPNYKRYQTLMNIENKNCLSGSLLTVIPGAEIDSDYIYSEIDNLIKTYTNVREVIFDPWQSHSVMTRLQKNHPKIVILEMPQTAKYLSPGMKELTGAIISKRIHHDGNKILTWNLQNVESKTDKNGNEFPTNQNPKVNKKDGAVCLIMCANRTENFVPKARTSELIKSGGGLRF